MSKKFLLPLFVLSFLTFVRPAGAIVLGQVDDFQSGTAMNWLNGASAVELIASGGPMGLNDAYIQVTADGSGPGGRLVAQNYNNPFAIPPITSQWTGNYLTAGVTAIELDLINQSAFTLSIRIAFKTEILLGSPGYLSLPVILAPGSGWQHFSISLSEADLIAIGGPAAYSTFFQNGFAEMRIINSANGDDLNGDPVVGQLGIDNIRAVPEPTVTALALGGLFLLGAKLRRRALRS